MKKKNRNLIIILLILGIGVLVYNANSRVDIQSSPKPSCSCPSLGQLQRQSSSFMNDCRLTANAPSCTSGKCIREIAVPGVANSPGINQIASLIGPSGWRIWGYSYSCGLFKIYTCQKFEHDCKYVNSNISTSGQAASVGGAGD